nr:immunoglobulin heavy chain junction region [Macaca mulatta]
CARSCYGASGDYW